MHARFDLNQDRLKKLAVELALVAILSVVYVTTLLPGIGNSGDTAKFQFVGRFLGTPHGSGYPTYIFLNFLFTTLVPFGSIAYRANLLSAIFTVVAALYFYRMLLLLEVPSALSMAAALSLGLTPTLWLQSLFAEVYTLHVLFVTTTVYFTLRWSRTRRESDFLLTVTLYAFSFGNHLTTVLLLPALGYAIWTTDRRVLLHRRSMVIVATAFAASAAQYLYFVWRTFDPTTLYLEMRASSLREFLWFVSGGQFRGAMFAFSPAELIAVRIPMFLRLVAREFGPLLVLAPLGFLGAKDRRLHIFFGLYFAANLLYSLSYGIPDIYPYFLPNYLVVMVYIALGLSFLWARVPLVARPAAALAAFSLPAILYLSNLQSVDQHLNDAKTRETLAVLETVDRDALIVVADYNVYEYLMYYQIAEGWGRRGIRALYRPSIENVTNDIKSYLYEDQGEGLGNAPPGLPVYFAGVSPDLVTQIESFGLRLVEVRTDLLFLVAE